jgi:hypothetical protein
VAFAAAASLASAFTGTAASTTRSAGIIITTTHLVVLLIVSVPTITLFRHLASPFCKVKTLWLVTELPSQFAHPLLRRRIAQIACMWASLSHEHQLFFQRARIQSRKAGRFILR